MHHAPGLTCYMWSEVHNDEHLLDAFAVCFGCVPDDVVPYLNKMVNNVVSFWSNFV
jgi:hypothetical protein